MQALPPRFSHIIGVSLLTALTLFSACQPEPEGSVPEVAHLRPDLELRRFEQDLFQLDTSEQFAADLARLEDRYGEFARIFFQQVLGSQGPQISREEHEQYIRGFVTYPQLRHLYDTVSQVYGDMEQFREGMQQALAYYRYYFPDRPVPTITTFISEFTVQAFIYGRDDLAVGLDFFLGQDYPYQKFAPRNPAFSAYLTRTYNRDHLLAKTLQPLVQDLVGPPARDRLLDHMLLEGKRLYLLNTLLPHTPDTVIMEVSAEQWTWLQENESNIWSYLLTEGDQQSQAQSLLYSTDWATFRKFVEYSPHSPGMPAEAPGRTASFLGWRIVSAWMKKQPPRTGLQALLMETDAQRLLEESRYKPRR